METRKLTYKITFFSDWHAGSGLSSGAEADNVVIKDNRGFPYLPGKTIKGLLKSALMDLHELEKGRFPLTQIDACFGKEAKKLKTDELASDRDSEKTASSPGSLFFSNAEISSCEMNEISSEMIPFLYRNVASTKIEKNGVVADGSLRVVEVCIPLTLVGWIDGVAEADVEILRNAMRYTRHIGASRNRGLGRCKFTID